MGNYISREVPGMHAVLVGLVDRTIETMSTRQPNRILGVSADKVLVATDRSPDGKPVKIVVLQDAVERLYRDGELEISKDSVGYRSAFVGAVLAALPDTVVELRPRRIRLVAS